MKAKFIRKVQASSMLEVLITLSIMSLVFCSNIILLGLVIRRASLLDKRLQTFIELENNYELSKGTRPYSDQLVD
jgi:hypothetical protein